MISPWTEKRLGSQLKVLKFVWVAMILSQGTLAFVLFNQPQPEGTSPLTPAELLQDPFVQILGVVAVIILALSQFVGRLFISPANVRRFRAEPQSAEQLRSLKAGKGQAPLYTEADIQTLLALPEQERLLIRISGPYAISKIVQYALCDACGLLGFAIAMNRNTPVAFLPFAAAAVLGILSSPPRRSDLIDFTKQI